MYTAKEYFSTEQLIDLESGGEGAIAIAIDAINANEGSTQFIVDMFYSLDDDKIAVVDEHIARWKHEKDGLVEEVFGELQKAYNKHGDIPWSRHEFYAILLEEVDELWDDIKNDQPYKIMKKEILQIAAMCFRYLEQED